MPDAVTLGSGKVVPPTVVAVGAGEMFSVDVDLYRTLNMGVLNDVRGCDEFLLERSALVDMMQQPTFRPRRDGCRIR